MLNGVKPSAVVMSDAPTACDVVTRPLALVVILWKALLTGFALTVANVRIMLVAPVPLASPLMVIGWLVTR